MLLGTSMWYAFHGEILSSASAFEKIVDAVCRELGSRGRADAVVSVAAAAEPAPEESADVSDLVHELRGVKLMALSKRAVSIGVSTESVEDAMDADDARSALIGLIGEVESRRGPAKRALACLEGGGDACAEMVSAALEHAMDVLEELSLSSPRKSRKSLLETMERVEAVLDLVDADWCDGVSRCGHDELDRLSGLIVCIRGVSSSSGASEVSGAVKDALECLDRCGSLVVQCMGLLSGSAGDDVDGSGAAVLIALESLRGLSES